MRGKKRKNIFVSFAFWEEDLFLLHEREGEKRIEFLGGVIILLLGICLI